jgi:hypothetical protein
MAARSVWALLEEELEQISVNQRRSAKEWIFSLIPLNHSQFVKIVVALW